MPELLAQIIKIARETDHPYASTSEIIEAVDADPEDVLRRLDILEENGIAVRKQAPEGDDDYWFNPIRLRKTPDRTTPFP